MQTQLAVAKHTLFSEDALHVSNIKLFPGASRDVTSEQMAEQINRVIEQLGAGDFEDGETIFLD